VLELAQGRSVSRTIELFRLRSRVEHGNDETEFQDVNFDQILRTVDGLMRKYLVFQFYDLPINSLSLGNSD